MLSVIGRIDWVLSREIEALIVGSTKQGGRVGAGKVWRWSAGGGTKSLQTFFTFLYRKVSAGIKRVSKFF